MKKIIYTCITGNYDTIKKPKILTPGWEYRCYTNNKTLLKYDNYHGYKILPINLKTDLVRGARFEKIMAPHINAPVFIWHDANMSINCNLDTFVRLFLKNNDLALAVHPHRNCLFKEGNICKMKKKDGIQIINKQLRDYRKKGMPFNWGLFATGVLVRRRFTKKTRRFYEHWWQNIQQYSRRDQISLAYCVFKYHRLINAGYFPFSEITKNFPISLHLPNRFGGKYKKLNNDKNRHNKRIN